MAACLSVDQHDHAHGLGTRKRSRGARRPGAIRKARESRPWRVSAEIRARRCRVDKRSTGWGCTMNDANRQPILEGNLSDFNLIEVLQVLSLSRQYTRVEVFDDRRFLLGSIHIKSGKVVQAVNRMARGRAAFLQLVRGPHSWFRVFRIEMPALVPEPIGSLSSLFAEAL